MTKGLEKHLNELKTAGKMLVVPYIMAGDGGVEKLEERLLFLEECGVSAIEIGIPFSDPVADGPVIQAAGSRALDQKTTLQAIISKLQKTTVQLPLIVMSYFNPIYRLGLEKVITELKETPVKGLIIPDLPFEHREYIEPLLTDTDIALIPLLSLTSPKERMKEIAEYAEGFIYAVTVNGTTGARTAFAQNIEEHLTYLSSVSSVPVLAGFGVSAIQHVQKFSQACDGVIIGSKVVQLLAEKKNSELATFLKEAAAFPGAPL